MHKKNVKLKDQISEFSVTSLAISKVGLIVFEKQKDYSANLKKVEKILSYLKYKKSKDYVELMENLSSGKDKIFYIENDKNLDGSALEIIAEFEAGMVTLLDRKSKSVPILKTIQWNPLKISLIVLMTRKQIENSYPRLFEYINIVKSI